MCIQICNTSQIKIVGVYLCQGERIFVHCTWIFISLIPNGYQTMTMLDQYWCYFLVEALQHAINVRGTVSHSHQ